MENTMQILHFNKKGTQLDKVKRFCVYKETAKNNQHIQLRLNKIFEATFQGEGYMT
jgi:hypothetical protein